MIHKDEKDLEQPTVLVTGASSGIGREICIRLISDGFKVIASGRNTKNLNDLKDSVSHPKNLIVEVKDVAQDTGLLNKWVYGLSKKYGKLQGAILSAGILHISPLRAVTEKQLQDIFRINFEANFWLSKGFCDKRVNVGEGSSLVIISSISSIIGQSGLAGYSASKGALNSLTRSLAKEFSSSGVRVNAVLPGLVKTELIEKWEGVYTEEYLQQAEQEYPLGIGLPDDVSGVVSFLMSKDARWITGVCLPVDGGATL